MGLNGRLWLFPGEHPASRYGKCSHLPRTQRFRALAAPRLVGCVAVGPCSLDSDLVEKYPSSSSIPFSFGTRKKSSNNKEAAIVLPLFSLLSLSLFSLSLFSLSVGKEEGDKSFPDLST